MAESTTTTLLGILKINSTAAKNYITNKLSSYATKSDVTASLDKKQDKLTFDVVPAIDSNNPVTSDGIKKAIDAKTVDLSSYYTKTQVDTAITDAISAITDGDNNSY